MSEDGGDTTDGETSILQILLPVNRAVSLWVSLFALSLAVLGFIAIGFIWLSESVLAFGSTGAWVAYVLALAAIVGAGVNGYLNDDLVVSLFIAVAPLAGFVFFTATIGALTDLSELSSTGQTAVVIGVLTVVVGSIAGGIGVWAGRVYGGGPGTPGLR
jgi:hypothetical protein